jgi:pyruvate,orthophosphate dikinase
MAAVILADSDEDRHAAIEVLRPLQEDDYEQILIAMAGRPVCVRLLDPPLNEFLPEAEDLPEGSPERARVESLQEENPMLGTRGVRLGILQPELYEMQVRALFRAAARVPDADIEVMVPLVDYEQEMQFMRELIDKVGAQEGATGYKVGSMIELPRACFLADRIAVHTEFFSFGTNDLTQTGLGFSREDIEARILERYMDIKVLDRSPFETIDEPGVGQMLRMGAWLGRKTKLDLKLGVCGEHGGDPDSIAFFDDSGIDYVSCSPPRVPVARLAAAQAAIASPRP